MQTVILSKEDFKELEYWLALCDKLEISNEPESIVLAILAVVPNPH